MKHNNLVSKVFFIFLFSVLTTSNGFCCRIEKGYEALSIFNYFKAKKLFEKSLKRHTAPSAYGLSIIYYRNDNPFHNLDSAYKYIQIAHKRQNELKDRIKIKLDTFNYNTQAIKNTRQNISTAFFKIAVSKNSVLHMDEFIKSHSWSILIPNAIYKRDSIAFSLVKEQNISSGFTKYQSDYPNSTFNKEAQNLFYQSQYNEYTKNNTVSELERFIKECPSNPHIKDAENNLYHKVTNENDLKSFDFFIKKYPQNSNINDAWEKLYNLYMMEFNQEIFDEFKSKYPDFPFMEKLEKDYKLSSLELLPFEKNEKWGLINKTGKVYLKPFYDEIGLFHEDLAIIGLNDKYGFINKSKKKVIPIKFDGVSDFEFNRSIVEIDEKYGMINRAGAYILNPVYNDLGTIQENKMYFSKDSLYGYMNKDGAIIIPEKFEEGFSFENGSAKVIYKGKEAIIDSTGKFLFPPKYDQVSIFTDSIYIVKKDGLCGLVSHSEKEILPCIYSDIGVLHENMSQIILDDLLGFINGKGEIVIKPKYDTPLNYQDLCVFKSGKATVSKSDKYGAIDTTGKVVIKFSQHQLGRINSLFPYKKKELWGYMNLNGKSIVDPIYNYAEDIKDGSCLVQKDTLFGCLNSKGKIIIPIEFDNIQQLNETPYLIVQKNSLLGIIKTNGEVTLQNEYTNIIQISPSYLKLIKNEEMLYFNLINKEFIKINSK